MSMPEFLETLMRVSISATGLKGESAADRLEYVFSCLSAAALPTKDTILPEKELKWVEAIADDPMSFPCMDAGFDIVQQLLLRYGERPVQPVSVAMFGCGFTIQRCECVRLLRDAGLLSNSMRLSHVASLLDRNEIECSGQTDEDGRIQPVKLSKKETGFFVDAPSLDFNKFCGFFLRLARIVFKDVEGIEDETAQPWYNTRSLDNARLGLLMEVS